jgi:hypothetical protein
LVFEELGKVPEHYVAKNKFDAVIVLLTAIISAAANIPRPDALL